MTVIESGQAFRVAAESGDFERTLTAEWDWAQARQAERNRPVFYTGYMSESLFAAGRDASFPSELGLPDARLSEMRVVLSMARSYYGLDVVKGVRAVLLGLPLPLPWPRFSTDQDELLRLHREIESSTQGLFVDADAAGPLDHDADEAAEWLHLDDSDDVDFASSISLDDVTWTEGARSGDSAGGKQVPARGLPSGLPQTGRPNRPLWKPILLDETKTPWAAHELENASFDARTVLAYADLIKRRVALTREDLARSTLLPYERLDAALTELERLGHAGPATMESRLMALTLEQMRPLLRRVGVPVAGKKAVLAARAAQSARDGAVFRRLSEALNAMGVPADSLSVGLDAGADADWFIAFADLVANWLTAGLLRADADLAYPNASYWAVTRDPSCLFAADVKSPVKRHRVDDLPPYCAGCNCVFRPVYRKGIPVDDNGPIWLTGPRPNYFTVGPE